MALTSARMTADIYVIMFTFGQLTFEVFDDQFLDCRGLAVGKRRCMSVKTIAGTCQRWEISSLGSVCHVFVWRSFFEFLTADTRGWRMTVAQFAFPSFSPALILNWRLARSWQRHSLTCLRPPWWPKSAIYRPTDERKRMIELTKVARPKYGANLALCASSAETDRKSVV